MTEPKYTLCVVCPNGEVVSVKWGRSFTRSILGELFVLDIQGKQIAVFKDREWAWAANCEAASIKIAGKP